MPSTVVVLSESGLHVLLRSRHVEACRRVGSAHRDRQYHAYGSRAAGQAVHGGTGQLCRSPRRAYRALLGREHWQGFSPSLAGPGGVPGRALSEREGGVLESLKYK